MVAKWRAATLNLMLPPVELNGQSLVKIPWWIQGLGLAHQCEHRTRAKMHSGPVNKHTVPQLPSVLPD